MYYEINYKKHDEYGDFIVRDDSFETEEELKQFIKNNLTKIDKIVSIRLVKKETTKLDINKFLK